MRKYSLRPELVLLLACLLAGLLFLVGLAVPNTPLWGRFLIPIGIVFFWGRRRDIYLVTALVCMLVLATYWVNGPTGTGDFLVGYLLPIAVLGAAAWLLAQRRQLQEELETQQRLLLRQQQELAAEVAARTAELRAGEQRYRTLAENSRDLVYTVDLNGTLTYVSPAVARLRGVTPAEELATPWEERMPPQYAADVKRQQEADLAALRAGEHVDSTPHIRQVYHKDGSLIWTETIVSPLYDDDGRPVGLCGVTRDITVRHAAQEALRQSEARLAKIFRSNPGGIAIARQSDGGFVDANRAFLNMIGYTRDQILGRNPAELGLVTPDVRLPVRSAALQNEFIRGVDLQITSAQGQAIDVLLSVEQLDVDGEPCLLLLAVDVTARKRLEQELRALNEDLEGRVAARTADLQSAMDDLRRANQLKDEFMAMISHELRTPLTSVLALSEMLADQIVGPLNARQSLYVKGIGESGYRLLNVVNGILSYTQLISGGVQIEREPCDLAYLLATCAAAEKAKAAAKEQAITVHVDPTPLTVTSDAVALAEVLKRLLDNAVKFTPVGGQIGLEAHHAPGAQSVELVVWDTGIGLDPAQLDHILKPFIQADARLARAHEGVGMGLAYVDYMIRQLGGTLAVQSEPGKGSRFTITLPC